MKKVKLVCVALLAMVAMVSCRGPQGPEGPMGNANVASSTVTVYPNDWYKDGNTSWRVDISYDAINANITDHGAVLVYMNNENTWRQLPMTYYYTDVVDGETYYLSSSLEVSSYDNGVSILWTESDFYLGDDYRPDTHQFKIVVIAASLYNARPDVNYNSYEAVKTAFQLEDR